MTKQEFKNGIDDMMELFSHSMKTKTFTKRYLEIYYQAVKYIDNDTFQKAIVHITQTENYFPNPASFCNYEKELNKNKVVINLDEMGIYND